jgi:hypothetical protein
MPRFYGWCDFCVKFYLISMDEWERQVIECAQIALSDNPKIHAKAGKQLCPECEKKNTTLPRTQCHRAVR